MISSIGGALAVVVGVVTIGCGTPSAAAAGTTISQHRHSSTAPALPNQERATTDWDRFLRQQDEADASVRFIGPTQMVIYPEIDDPFGVRTWAGVGEGGVRLEAGTSVRPGHPPLRAFLRTFAGQHVRIVGPVHARGWANSDDGTAFLTFRDAGRGTMVRGFVEIESSSIDARTRRQLVRSADRLADMQVLRLRQLDFAAR